jgi:hypothetical protein
MNPVTTGQGVSGVVVGRLQGLIEHLRTETGDARWHLHMQAIQVPAYSLRVYAPDRHSASHNITMTTSLMETVWAILEKEAGLWQTRVRAALDAPPVNRTESAGPA